MLLDADTAVENRLPELADMAWTIRGAGIRNGSDESRLRRVT
jgi:hypothetical protein